MIYDYYCMGCGRKFDGKEISFDLAEFLGLRGERQIEAVESRSTQIGTDRLRKMARKSGVQLKHKEPVRICITLKDLLKIMGENTGEAATARLMETYSYTELGDAITMVYSSMANQEVAGQIIQEYRAALRNKFVYTGTDEENAEDEEEAAKQKKEERNKTENYQAYFWIVPEFFDEGKSDGIYSVEYSYEKDPVNMKKIMAPTLIRGYCPSCGQPVINGAGKYRHNLIGLLGAQSAGKTSTITAMLSELKKSYRELGVKYPGNPLCDGRYSERESSMALYENHWAVRKTNVYTNAGTFNASVLLESAQGGARQILTFIDIAGEQCYDLETHTMNRTALDVYPLINNCQIYLLCTCINRKGYGNADGEDAVIPPDAVLEIANAFYANLREKENVPPLCIVATKADMAVNASAGSVRDNPFHGIKSNAGYLYKNQLELMSNIYDTVNDEDIKEPLRWCCDTLNELKNITYVSMLSCSALGRKGVLYDGEMADIQPYKNDRGKEEPFMRQRLDVLWRWLLQVTGVIPLDGKYTVKHIPSYGESYLVNDEKIDGRACSRRRVYTAGQIPERISAVKKLFINWSPADKRMNDALMEEITFWEKIRRITKEKRIVDIVESLR